MASGVVSEGLRLLPTMHERAQPRAEQWEERLHSRRQRLPLLLRSIFLATREIETIGRGGQVDPADGNHRQLGAPIGHGQHQSVPVECQLGEPARSGTRRCGSLTFGRRTVEIAPLHCDSASVDLLHLHHPEHTDNIPNLYLIFAATVVTAGRWLLTTIRRS